MKLILRNYLAALREEGELDRICVEILKDKGLTVFSAPQKGTRQYGVDVLAKGCLDDDTGVGVYALIIKCKDIDRIEFDRQKTGIRSSMLECLDVYVRNHLPCECKGLPFRVCIVCGGEIKHEVRENINSLFEEEKKRHQQDGLCLELKEWNGARLSEMMMSSLSNENMLVRGQKKLLFRALALASEPDSSFEAFKTLVDDLIAESEKDRSDAEKRKHLQCVNLALAMLIEMCDSEEVNNRDASWRAAEYAYLKLWECLKEDEILDGASYLYCKNAESYLNRIADFTEDRYSFTLSVQGNNEVDVILRFYDVMSRLTSFGLYLKSRGMGMEVRRKILSVLEKLIVNNVASVMPLLDSHASSIGMALLYLYYDGRTDLSEVWLELLVSSIATTYKQGYAYPCVGKDYAKLIDHMHANVNSRDIGRNLKSSELIPMLLMLSKILHRDDLYLSLIRLVNELPRTTDYQVWFLDHDSDGLFYSGDPACGAQLSSLPVSDAERFVSIVQCESRHSPIELSCNKTQHSGLIFIGCRHYDFPLPGNFFATAMSKSLESLDGEISD